MKRWLWLSASTLKNVDKVGGIGPDVDLIDALFKMISASYADIGGHSRIASRDDVPGRYDWWLVYYDNKNNGFEEAGPRAAIFGRSTPWGLKLSGMATCNGFARIICAKMLELCDSPGFYAEISGPIEDFLRAHGAPFVHTPEWAQVVLDPKLIHDFGIVAPGSYARWSYSQRKMITKTMFGRPNREHQVLPSTPASLSLSNLVSFYLSDLRRIDVKSRRAPGDMRFCNVHNTCWEHASWEHASWMLEEMTRSAASQGDDKFHRWLGFVQGILWCTGAFSIDELRKQTTSALNGPAGRPAKENEQ